MARPYTAITDTALKTSDATARAAVQAEYNARPYMAITDPALKASDAIARADVLAEDNTRPYTAITDTALKASDATARAAVQAEDSAMSYTAMPDTHGDINAEKNGQDQSTGTAAPAAKAPVYNMEKGGGDSPQHPEKAMPVNAVQSETRASGRPANISEASRNAHINMAKTDKATEPPKTPAAARMNVQIHTFTPAPKSEAKATQGPPAAAISAQVASRNPVQNKPSPTAGKQAGGNATPKVERGTAKKPHDAKAAQASVPVSPGENRQTSPSPQIVTTGMEASAFMPTNTKSPEPEERPVTSQRAPVAVNGGKPGGLRFDPKKVQTEPANQDKQQTSNRKITSPNSTPKRDTLHFDPKRVKAEPTTQIKQQPSNLNTTTPRSTPKNDTPRFDAKSTGSANRPK